MEQVTEEIKGMELNAENVETVGGGGVLVVAHMRERGRTLFFMCIA